MKIEYLSDHPSFIPILAEWHFNQWGYLNPANDVERRIADMSQHGKMQVPTTFVAVEGELPIGSASLIGEDMDNRKDLTPWLASVFVDPAQRNKGLGSLLVQRVVDEAKSLRIPRVYLYTPDRESFYARMGWSVLEKTVYHNEKITIMEISLSP